jgi:predicted DCC family thiol-disulfide oxidoreductase YuxK
VINPGEGVLIFDGDCAFCTSAANWIRTRVDDPTATHVVASQTLSDVFLADHELTRADVDEAIWWIGDDGTQRAEAAFAASLERWRRPWWLVGRALAARPLQRVGAAVYPVVARNRHRLPGADASYAVAPGSLKS